MKGDFSRDTFDVAKHFSRVLQQQGRVQLDADWNEQTAILLHYLRTLAADLIGPFAGPEGNDVCGFKIEEPSKNNKEENWDFSIGKGRYYVDGILCENDESKITYLTQTDYPKPPAIPNTSAADESYLVYLDVWERHITALEDDTIREKALGKADTATRAQVVWQVKILEKKLDQKNKTRKDFLNNWKGLVVENLQLPHRGCLRARVKPPKDSKDPCLTAPDAKYRGPENQLYRVEIHKGGEARDATFKWSRDNGAIVTACELSGTELTVHNPRGFAVGQWVELLADEQEKRGEAGTLVKIAKVDDHILKLDEKILKDLRDHKVFPPDITPTKVRRWDHVIKGTTLLGGALKIEEVSSFDKDNEDALWIPLEDGVEIQFLALEEVQYRSGDYWLIPARVATGNIEWTEEEVTVSGAKKVVPASKPPNGIRHHYAPLAILKTTGITWDNNPTDLRCEFNPLRKTCGLSYSYGEEGIGGHLDCNPPTAS